MRYQVAMLEVAFHTQFQRDLQPPKLKLVAKGSTKMFSSQTEAFPYTLIMTVVKSPLTMTPIHMTHKKLIKS